MKIVCLANSFREGGRCLGGILLDNNNHPVFDSGRPKWIRPVYNLEEEQVPVHIAGNISLLDIIEFENQRNTGHGHQTENVLIKGAIRVVGQYPANELERLAENQRHITIFGNRGKALHSDVIESMTYSLKLLRIEEFEISEKMYENRDYPQIRLSFRYRGALYDLPITDPVFLHNYSLNNEILENHNHIYLTMSLAAPFENWYYKLVAGITFQNYSRSINATGTIEGFTL